MMNHTKVSVEVLTPAMNVAARPQDLHPHVLLAHWEMRTRNGEWSSAWTVAEALVATMPGEPIGWICRSFALQQLGRIHEAREQLLKGANRFPTEWRIAYNLACYSCQLGDIGGAWNWLDRAIELGDADSLKSLALEEPSLKALGQKAGPVSPDVNRQACPAARSVTATL